MKTITVEQFLRLNPGYGEEWIKKMAGDKTRWSAIDILMLDDIPANVRLLAVLHPQLIPERLLHEFACRCAENALALIDKPDQRGVAAIAGKRDWLRDEISDTELYSVWAAAGDAAKAAWNALDAACAAARPAGAAAGAAAWDAARHAAVASAGASAGADAWDAEWNAQIKMLIKMLTEDAESEVRWDG